MKRILYIDFENVSTMGLRGVDALTKHDHVKIFLGPKCSKMSLIDADVIFHSDATVELIKNDQIGKNALDFIIMVHMGYDIAKKAGDAFFIISNDKGYDPAIHEMLSMTGGTIERLPSIRAVLERKEEKVGIWAGLFGKKTANVDNTTQHEVIGKNGKNKNKNNGNNGNRSGRGDESGRGGNKNDNARNRNNQERGGRDNKKQDRNNRDRSGSGQNGRGVEQDKNRSGDNASARNERNASQNKNQEKRRNQEKRKNEVMLNTSPEKELAPQEKSHNESSKHMRNRKETDTQKAVQNTSATVVRKVVVADKKVIAPAEPKTEAKVAEKKAEPKAEVKAEKKQSKPKTEVKNVEKKPEPKVEEKTVESISENTVGKSKEVMAKTETENVRKLTEPKAETVAEPKNVPEVEPQAETAMTDVKETMPQEEKVTEANAVQNHGYDAKAEEPIKASEAKPARPEIKIVIHDEKKGAPEVKVVPLMEKTVPPVEEAVEEVPTSEAEAMQTKAETPQAPADLSTLDPDSKQYMQELLRRTLEEPEEEAPRIPKKKDSTKVELSKQPKTKKAINVPKNVEKTPEEEAIIRQALEDCIGKEEFHNYLSQRLRDNDRVAILYKSEKKNVFDVTAEEKQVINVAMERCSTEAGLYGYLMSEIKNSERAAAIYQRERKHLPKNK